MVMDVSFSEHGKNCHSVVSVQTKSSITYNPLFIISSLAKSDFFFLWMFWPWNENIFSREFTLKKKESMGGCVWTTFPFNTETFLHKNTTKLTNFIKCSWYFLFKNVTRGYLLFSQIHHLFKNHSSWKCTFLHRIHRPKVTVLSRISFLSQGLCLKFKLKILCEIMTDFPC